MLPPNAHFLDALIWTDIENRTTLLGEERQLILAVLRCFFGPAQQAGSVQNVSSPASLQQLNAIMRSPGERYDELEAQTSLPAHFFDGTGTQGVAPKLYIAKKTTAGLPPRYFGYEPTWNLTLYIGPDILHNVPQQTVINCVTLTDSFVPDGSYTLRL
jgi:hypothetical protein